MSVRPTAAQLTLTSADLYGLLQGNNVTGDFNYIDIGRRMPGRTYRLRDGTRRLKLVLEAESNETDPNRRYIHVRGDTYRVNVDHQDWNPVVPEVVPDANAGAPHDDAGAPHNDAGAPHNDAGAPHNDAGAPQNDAGALHNDAGAPHNDANAPHNDDQNDDQIAQPQVNAEGNDTAEAVPNQQAQNEPGNLAHPHHGANGNNEVTISFADMTVPNGMNISTARVYMTYIKCAKFDCPKIFDLAIFVSDNLELRFSDTWLMALHNKSYMRTVYGALVGIVRGNEDRSKIFLDTMFKLNFDHDIPANDLDFVVPHGMKRFTALSCWFMLEQMRSNHTHSADVRQWCLSYEGKQLIADTLWQLYEANLELMPLVHFICSAIDHNVARPPVNPNQDADPNQD